jgi:hypothetical protein
LHIPELVRLWEKFYGITIRALFGTRDKERLQQLSSTGLFPKRRLEPFSVMDSVDALAKEAGFESLRQRYETLCDYVHHNGASLSMSHANRFSASEVGVGGQGAKIVLTGEAVFATYSDPSQRRRQRGEELVRNATWFLDDAFLGIHLHQQHAGFPVHAPVEDVRDRRREHLLARRPPHAPSSRAGARTPILDVSPTSPTSDAPATSHTEGPHTYWQPSYEEVVTLHLTGVLLDY